MKNKLLYLLSFLVITFAAHGQTQQGKKGFLSFDGVQVHALSDPGLQRFKMAWASDDSETQVDSQTLYGNQPSLFIRSSQGKGAIFQIGISWGRQLFLAVNINAPKHVMPRSVLQSDSILS